jgi:hypothetical protein
MTDTEFYTTAASLMLYGVDDDDNSMTHHGIKGQQWGRRRYQNSDGSLTELGKKRYKTYEEKKKEWAKDPKKVYKHRKEFTTEELEAAARKQAAQNDLKKELTADNEEKILARQQRRSEKEVIRQMKAQEDIEKLRIKSEERKHKISEDIKMALQKQKDDAQAKRDEIARKQKKLEETKKGKTLLARLQKADKMSKAVSSTFESANKFFKSIGMEQEFLDWWQQLKPKTNKP